MARTVQPVLVVEDDAPTREALALILEMKGYGAVACEDGLDALAWLRAGGRPCVILLDIRMPNMDGMSFRRALRAEPRWSEIPVVIYSVIEPDEVEGADSVVQKGTDEPEVLLAAVEQACERQGVEPRGRLAGSSGIA